MHFLPNQTLTLTDAQDRKYGEMTLETQKEHLLQGVFVSGPDFSLVAALFRQFEDAVNDQALGVVDELDTTIAGLGLELCLPTSSERLPIHDVQIWSDGGMSCRLVPLIAEPLNGAAVTSAASEPAAGD